jgi:hypothetical protein
MPWTVAVGFQHLCRTYGKEEPLPRDTLQQAHADLMARITERMSQ